jgi:hypothetical protein
MRGLKRGLGVGVLLAVGTFLLPDSLLGALTVGSGLASVLPAAAPPLGTTARLLLAIVALVVGFGLTFWLVRRHRPAWDADDSYDPLPAAEQMVVTPTATPAATPAPAVAADPQRLSERLARLEAAMADGTRATAAPAADASLLPRIEALEASVAERLAAIEARLAQQAPATRTGGLELPAARLLTRRLAEIRHSIDAG